MGYLLAAIPLLPAASFALLAPMSRKLRNRAVPLSIAAMVGSLVLSLAAFGQVVARQSGGVEAAAEHASKVVYHAFWSIAPGGSIGFGLLLDPISAVMLIVVTVVGLCVQVYSLGYMHAEERIGWYYAVLSLFTSAMLAVVLADNFLMLYMAWEIMGLCSYLLIGFWHTEEAPRKASIKAFLTTRVGDIGFALGLAAMFAVTRSFSYDVVLPSAASWAPATATLVALLLLFGAMGKSAQFPLHVWLPDAMAGPTPASALIHAATMVAAGVYLVLRALPIFVASGVALSVTMTIGIITTLLGGTLALVQYDIKKVLAYSTISQLGYMFVALGTASEVAALYHLVTHAFFKSLLFLAAGVLIHSTHTQDMREMGGLRRKMPVTAAVFTVGSLALAGVFPLSGFFSKDEILAQLLHGHHYGFFAGAMLGALLTAFYCTRLWVRVFYGEGSDNAHEGHRVMLAPMVVLAAITVVLGAASVWFAGFLGHEGEWPTVGLLAMSTATAFVGIGAGWWVYGMKRVDTEVLKERLRVPYLVLQQKYYMDFAYDRAFVRPFYAAADALARFDLGGIDRVVNGAAAAWVAFSGAAKRFDVSVIDGSVNRTADAVQGAGERLRRLQTGRVQNYQRFILGAVVLLLAWVIWLWPWLVTVLKGA